MLGPVLSLHLGHTLAQPYSERPHPQTLVPTVSLKERVFPGYPHTPKTPILGPTRTLSPKVFLKNEFSQGTNQAGRVPTWPLYNTHWVAPLCLVPFLGYTGVIPLLNHNKNGPHPQTLVPTVSLKNQFSHDTHLPFRVPTWPFYNTCGVASLCLAPVSGNEALQHAKKNLFYSGSHRDIFAQGLPKNEFSVVPTRRVEYPHVISITPMGSHPCALTHSLATLGSYPCSTIVRMTPSIDSCTHSLSSLKTSFPMIPTYPAWPIYNTHRVARLGSAPVYGNKALLDAKKTYFKYPSALSPKVSLKTSFTWVPTRRIEYPHGPSIIPTGWHPWTLTRF